MNYNGWTFRKLEIFLVYMESFSMAKAAERLNMTSVGVHRALHSLEDHLRCRLFHSEGHQLKPTQSAFVFKRHAAHMLEYIESAASQCREIAENERITVRVGTLFSLTTRFIPEVISRLTMTQPHLRVELVANSNQLLLERLNANLLDAIIISTSADFHGEGYQADLLFEDEIFLVTAADNALVLTEPVDLRDLQNEKFVTLSDGFATFQGLQQSASRAGFSPHLALQVHDIFTVCGLVRAGVGYSLLPGRMRYMYPDLQFIALQDHYNIRQQVSLLMRKEALRDHAELATLRHVCIDYATQYAAEEKVNL